MTETDVSIEPLIGWRAWTLVMHRAGRDPALRPAAAGAGEWFPRRPYRAACAKEGTAASMLQGQHPSPVPECSCGIYASSSLRTLVTSTPAMPAVSAVGTVALWGRVIEHERGWRAEFAYPDRLTLVCVGCLRQGSGVGEPAFVVAKPVRTGPYPAVAVCTDHAISLTAVGHGMMSPAAVVRSALLDRYAVDLMPFDSVRSLFERDPVPVPFMAPRAAIPQATTPVRAIAVSAPAGQVSHAPSAHQPSPGLRLQPPERGSVPVRVAKAFGQAISVVLSWAVILMLCAFSLRSCVVTAHPSDAAGSSAPSVIMPTPASTEPSTLAAIRRPSDRRAPVIPDIAIVCGLPHGAWVELVSCKRSGSLLGWASSPPDKECLPDDVAMTRRYTYSICWHSFDGPVDLVPHPAAADPFEDER